MVPPFDNRPRTGDVGSTLPTPTLRYCVDLIVLVRLVRRRHQPYRGRVTDCTTCPHDTQLLSLWLVIDQACGMATYLGFRTA
jgi:hypothetical protein